MADFAVVAAEKLIEVIGNEIIKQICETWGYKSALENLMQTVSAIKDVLVDADHESAKRELTNKERGYIMKLKDAVYDADDLFDEFLTLAELKQIKTPSKVQRFFKKVSCIFSLPEEVVQAYRVSSQVKQIKKRLDTIADNRKKFEFNLQRTNCEHDNVYAISKRREETCSYVNEGVIIGRDEDKEKIINMLLGLNGYGDLSCVIIVGVGGCGKTALAQLIFNDKKIVEEFSENRLWVCVADQEGVEFDAKRILIKIVELVDKKQMNSSSSLELVVQEFRKCLSGKRYFLVLDDVWNEDGTKWRDFEQYLAVGQEGSRFVVTTRSELTSNLVGDEKHVVMLEGLSPENSWSLFERCAFRKQNDYESDDEFVVIGKKIVKKCYNIPLAIKVVGTLLYDQDIRKWKEFEVMELIDIGKGENKIFNILEFSYRSLTSSLKSCFTYCALFPKDFVIKKNDLLNLWMAQGYVVPLHSGQNIEDAAEDHFLILLRRCFFQDVKKDDYDDVVSFKIHDLLHDVAQKFYKEEFFVSNSITNNLEDRNRHMYCVKDTEYGSRSLCGNKIRSFFSIDYPPDNVLSDSIVRQIGSWKCLRVLCLNYHPYNILPDSIGKLMLLRYLNLSYIKDLEKLPDSFTKLHNLQTLVLCGFKEFKELPKDFCKLVKLRHLDLKECGELKELPKDFCKLVKLRHLDLQRCSKLNELPKDFCKLVKLRHLDLQGCSKLNELPKDFCKLVKLSHLDLQHCHKLACMPLSMDKLTNLRVLPIFTVSSIIDQNSIDSLKDLKALTKLKGGIEIKVGAYGGHMEGINKEERYLKSMDYLNKLKINAVYGKCVTEALLETLEPPPNLKDLHINSYEGKIIPSWNNWVISLKHLVYIYLSDCANLQVLPMLSKLPHLRDLTLTCLSNLEYMECDGSKEVESEVVFPSLEFLYLEKMYKFRGWGMEEGLVDDNDEEHLLKKTIKFPRLSTLSINYCPNLMSVLCCPHIKYLTLQGGNERLKIITGKENSEKDFELRKVKIDKLCYLKLLPMSGINSLKITGNEVKCLSEVGDVFQSCASSLQTLRLKLLKDQTTLYGLNHHLTALKELELFDNEQLSIAEDDEEPWKSYLQNLRSLQFDYLPKMKSLPKGMQSLTFLQTLQIQSCENLRSLPEWISCLSSLHSLTIYNCPTMKSLPEAISNLTSLKHLRITSCPELYNRSKEPDGVDFFKIQHIPKREIYYDLEW